MGSFSNPHISKCSMMPEWHQLVPMSGHVKESETAKRIATTRDFNIPGSFFCLSTRLLCTHWKQKHLCRNSLRNLPNLQITPYSNIGKSCFHMPVFTIMEYLYANPKTGLNEAKAVASQLSYVKGIIGKAVPKTLYPSVDAHSMRSQKWSNLYEMTHEK